MSKYDLAYKSIDELPQYTGGDTTVDFIPCFDTSAGRTEKLRLGGGTVNAGATLTLTAAAHGGLPQGGIINLNNAAGSIVTLPAATGSGNIYRFRVSVLATSNSHIVKVANASDVMQGFAVIADTDTAGAASMFMTAATSDTITLNRSTTGSVSVGEYIEVEDVATNTFLVRAYISGNGVVATPFSATV
jgi:hypothetical protein